MYSGNPGSHRRICGSRTRASRPIAEEGRSATSTKRIRFTRSESPETTVQTAQTKIALLLAAYAATIPTANWMIANIGTVCGPSGPCLVPVWPGVLAPSGVLAIGFALVLRDLVHKRAGAGMALVAVGVGTLISLWVAPPALALASALAFLFSELADLAVYAPLYRRRLALAVVLSGTAGAVVDSTVFLWLAFGDLSHLEGQIIGKLYASVLFAAWLFVNEKKGLCRSTE